MYQHCTVTVQISTINNCDYTVYGQGSNIDDIIYNTCWKNRLSGSSWMQSSAYNDLVNEIQLVVRENGSGNVLAEQEILYQ
jgi:hypothetical protein